MKDMFGTQLFCPMKRGCSLLEVISYKVCISILACLSMYLYLHPPDFSYTMLQGCSKQSSDQAIMLVCSIFFLMEGVSSVVDATIVVQVY